MAGATRSAGTRRPGSSRRSPGPASCTRWSRWERPRCTRIASARSRRTTGTEIRVHHPGARSGSHRGRAPLFSRAAAYARTDRDVPSRGLTASPPLGHPATMPQLTLGGWSLRTLETGFLWLDGGSMFGSVPKPLWSRLHPADERNRIRLAMRCLLADGHGRRILVDDGIGDKLSPKLADIY